LAALSVGKNYIVVDQANNRLYLRRGQDLLREAVCSSGSGYVLREGENGRTWVFDSPRGEFRVRSKIDKPVWKKPDWAFLEAGEPVPRDSSKRFEYGVLGEHALYFGNGFMIHGTLYERLLGRSVTHGCIRLGREDLSSIYDASPVGTQIFIY
jgi:L,D-transpeptidase YbiS